MSEYLVINIAIILVPLIFSFEKNLRFYKNIPAYLFSASIVSSFFIIWDYIAVLRGDWSFNPDYILGLKILALPIEEILFFVTVPYSCLFIYETINFYLDDRQMLLSDSLLVVLGSLLIVTGLLFYAQYYTVTVLVISGLIFLSGIILKGSVLFRRNYWITLAITYVPFFIVNYILTSMPIVQYNPAAIWNMRIMTIPVEDIFYSFSMITLWIYFYNVGKQKFLGYKWEKSRLR